MSLHISYPHESTSSDSTKTPLPLWHLPNNPLSLAPLPPSLPSSFPSEVSGGTAEELPKERKGGSISVDKMSEVLYGGPLKVHRRRFILGALKGSDASDKYSWTRSQQLKQHLKLFTSIHEPYYLSFTPTREDIGWMYTAATIKGTMANHFNLFVTTIKGQASILQQQEWLPRAQSLKIVGCYAQTELGHGSNVRGIRTVAEYDKSREEFVLNTPTLLSLKWWPGAMGKVATHALVYAQLIIEGKEYGVHVFFVQIRDENHRPLPGFELGDLGPKLGDNGNDTGFMRMTNVRIPRTNMLFGYQQVTAAGEYIKTQKRDPKIHYATMMFTRAQMIDRAQGALAKAVIIAVRYSIVRKQGFLNTSRGVSHLSEERKIIDYQVQRTRLFRQLSLSYAMKFSANWMFDKVKSVEGEYGSISTDLSDLSEISAMSAGLKAFCTYLAGNGIEDCRKCCGGNGYLMASGIAALGADYVWQTTAEGDWVILMLLTARYLLKQVENIKRKKTISWVCGYLYLVDKETLSLPPISNHLPDSIDFTSLSHLADLFDYIAAYKVVLAWSELEEKIKEGKGVDESRNECGTVFVEGVIAHCYNFMLHRFIDVLNSSLDPSISSVLHKLCCVFANITLLDNSAWGFLSLPQLSRCRSTVHELLNHLRPDALPLVDAFDFPDNVLNSVIGGYDGNVYEGLYESAKKSELNQTDPFDGYEEYLRPGLDLDYLAEGKKKYLSRL
eukprot:CAMPEP_0174275486 /NCGR_PEP_ID=MMETSP0439-20130205/59850_1 /TAXON_ID=0 /ORGANISM="Stereomyxa ramosa, Strain Chinc5" /LENGTH=726 /DNA_ID=CAMNT_0015367591 /DNA_START=8 /DNA_END=2188 /DNA_ORIENTATION=+